MKDPLDTACVYKYTWVEKKEDIMVAIALSENESDEFHNLSNIEDLARELGATVEEIHQYYESAMRELRPTARIKSFLPILAGRQVREIILEKRFRVKISNPAPASDNPSSPRWI